MSFVNHAEVAIVWRSGEALSASVRDAADGIVDVRWSADLGWSCTCTEPYGCSHVLAVKGIGLVAS